MQPETTMRARGPQDPEFAESAELVAARSVPAGASDASRASPPDDRPEIGSWWWVTDPGTGDESDDKSGYDRPGRQWLACVIEAGSNYAKVEGVRLQARVGLDEFPGRCRAEPDPRAFIDAQIDRHRGQVRRLMDKIRKLCHQLGVPVRQALAAAEPASTALAVVHGVDDVRKYRGALVRAKDKTLPELFAQVKAQHEQMAIWMRAELIPVQAELSAAKEVTEVISGKIHTVELYAGLQEEMACVREGAPAALDARVHLMQRMHFMDEECLARYEAGGMDFKDVKAFDAWLARDGNFGRILPHERCVVAFRIRRHDKDYGGLNPFISFRFHEKNKWTFLYIRNGGQLHRMSTSIEFSEGLFPRREDEDLLGDQELWIRGNGVDLDRHGGIITRRHRDAMIDHHRAQRSHAAQKLWQWHRAGKPEGHWLCTAVSEDFDYHKEVGAQYAQTGKPDCGWYVRRRCEADSYERLTPENLYHDDAMRRIRAAALEHNRIAVVVQGLLDRSTCLHPHPPWRIWTPEGFAAGVELVYDVSRAIVPGPVLDFEAYRRQLNRSLRPGCHAIGQRRVWNEEMEERYGDKAWRHEGRHGRGPSQIDRVCAQKRDGSCEFRWTRERVKAKWTSEGARPGYLRPTYPEIPVRWWCPAEPLTCVDAYTPGDFRLFYDDPRTRENYLRWAPILLACEDWHARRRLAPDEGESAPAQKKTRRRRSAKSEAKASEAEAKDEATEGAPERPPVEPLDERAWEDVFRLRIRSKRGELLSPEERSLVDRAFHEDSRRYGDMEPAVFREARPFGSQYRERSSTDEDEDDEDDGGDDG